MILILFGLAALAPACYSVWVFGQKLSTHWPRLRQSGWTWLGGSIAFVLGATSCLNRLDLVFSAMGDVFGPVVGVLVSDWVGRRGEWLGIRRTIAPSAVIAWGAGVLLATILDLLRVVNREYEDWCQPTSLWGLVASFVAFTVLTRLRSRSPAVPPITVHPGHLNG